MARMIDLIRASAVPANLMQSAAKGSLSVPPREMIEILVYLAVHNKIFSEQAQLTLAGWDEAASRAAASDPTTPKEVLDYLISPKNLRPALLPALLANPSVSEESLLEMAPGAGRDVVEIMLKSERVNQSLGILKCAALESESERNPVGEHPKQDRAGDVRFECSRGRKHPTADPRRGRRRGSTGGSLSGSTRDEVRKEKMCSTKAFWPIWPSTRTRSRPRLISVISQSAAFTKNSRPDEPAGSAGNRRHRIHRRRRPEQPPRRRRPRRTNLNPPRRNGEARCRRLPSWTSKGEFSWP